MTTIFFREMSDALLIPTNQRSINDDVHSSYLSRSRPCSKLFLGKECTSAVSKAIIYDVCFEVLLNK